MRRFIHKPFTLEQDSIKVSCDKDGIVTITSDHADEEFDEVKIPASLIYTIANMLKATVKVQFINEVRK